MNKIKLLLILIIIPVFVFSQQYNSYSSTFTTQVESDGSIIASIKGDIGSGPKFDNLNKLLIEFGERINKILLESNYVIDSHSESANVVDNELEIKLKIVKEGMGRYPKGIRYVWSRFTAEFSTENMYMGKNITKQDVVNDGEMYSSLNLFFEDNYITPGAGTYVKNNFREYNPVCFESNSIRNLNPQNPNIEYKLIIFGKYVSPKDVAIEFTKEKLEVFNKMAYNLQDRSKEDGIKNARMYFLSKTILPPIDEKKYLAEQKRVDLEDENKRKKNLAVNQNNSQSNNGISSNSTTDKKPNVYDAILKDFSSSDKSYLEKIKTMDSDPQHKTGN